MLIICMTVYESNRVHKLLQITRNGGGGGVHNRVLQ